MESGDWRAEVSADSRERIRYKISETLNRHIPFSTYEGLQELKKVAVRFEEKIYAASISTSDYLRKISLKMLTMDMETRSEDPMSDPMQSNSAANSLNPPIIFHNTPSFNSQGVSGAVGDWRAPLERERVVNKIMDSLKENLPFTRYDRLHELKKIAQRVEAEVFTAATSQSEYSRKICLNMLTMETRLQSYLSDSIDSNSAAISVNSSVPFNTTANGGDWQEEVYQKIKTMKDLYLLDLRPTQGASGAFGEPTLEPGDWRATVQADSRQRIVNKIMETLKRHVPFDGPEGLQELMKMAMKFEQRMYTECTSQSDYLRKISLKMLTMETRYPAANNV
ncbi:putative coactivator CBP, KIX domain superfamily, mediator complex subunit 15, KIX [Helianthus anomalus]